MTFEKWRDDYFGGNPDPHLKTAWSASRQSAIEEAAVKVESFAEDIHYEMTCAKEIADAVRALARPCPDKGGK